MSEDVILWCTAEFGFASLSDAPYDRFIPDAPEKKSGRRGTHTRENGAALCGNLTAVMVAVKGLPLTYNRDLQEDKGPSRFH